MPNHVTNKILFDASHADVVLSVIWKDDHFDFETLVPSPPNKYHGDLSGEDDKDFKVNWSNWNIANWGTKWGAYECTKGVDADGRTFIQFDTAWSPPYPILAAFCNRFQIPFEHRWYNEGGTWGVEEWGSSEWNKHVHRKAKRMNKLEDEERLARELKGWHHSDDDESIDAALSRTGTDGEGTT